MGTRLSYSDLNIAWTELMPLRSKALPVEEVIGQHVGQITAWLRQHGAVIETAGALGISFKRNERLYRLELTYEEVSGGIGVVLSSSAPANLTWLLLGVPPIAIGILASIFAASYFQWMRTSFYGFAGVFCSSTFVSMLALLLLLQKIGLMRGMSFVTKDPFADELRGFVKQSLEYVDGN